MSTTYIPNEIITDTRISAYGRLLYAYMLSVGEDFKNEMARDDLGISISSITKGIKQLMETGYVTREYNRKDARQFAGGYKYSYPHSYENSIKAS